MLGGSKKGLTLHFEKAAPDTLEQWLFTEARYIIGTFSKPSDLRRIYGVRTDTVMAECGRLGEHIVSGITMILDSYARKLLLTLVRLENGDTFLIDEKYALVENADTISLVDNLLLENGPRVFSVTAK